MSRPVLFIPYPAYSHYVAMERLAAEWARYGGRAVLFWPAGQAHSVHGPPGLHRIEIHSPDGADWQARLRGALGARGTVGPFRAIQRVADDYARLLIEATVPLRNDSGVSGVVTDQVLPDGRTIAEWLGVPFASLSVALFLNRHPDTPPIPTGWAPARGGWRRLRNRVVSSVLDWSVRSAYAQVKARRTALGLPLLTGEDALYANSRRLHLVQEPPSFTVGGAGRPLVHTGPLCLGLTERPPIELPGHGPVVVISLGTLAGVQAEVYTQLAEACATLEVRVVLVHVGALSETSRGRMPPNVTAASWISYPAEFSRADLAILHGGLSSVLEAAWHGVPLLVWPLALEQRAVAARLRESGAGRILPKDRRAWPGCIAAALKDASLAAGARRLQTELRGLAGVQGAVERIRVMLEDRADVPARAVGRRHGRSRNRESEGITGKEDWG
jgi:zeaxanthin glucosyltransferase